MIADNRDDWAPPMQVLHSDYGASKAAGAAMLSVLLAGEDVSSVVPDALMALPSVRFVGQIDHAGLIERLGQQGRLDILWLSGAVALDMAMAERIAAETARLGATIVCELDGLALDSGFAAFAHLPGAQFLSSPDAIDREVALAAARPDAGCRVAESASDAAFERIERLQEEVARISAALASLADHSAPYRPASRGGPVSFTPMVRSSDRSYRPETELAALTTSPAVTGPVDSNIVRRLLRQRRMREQFFPAELFADPAWDMLLDLYAARLEGHPVSVSSLCIAAAVPATTALRWIKTMTDSDLFERQSDPRDGRRIFIGLSPRAEQALERYFAALDSAR